MTDTSLSSPIHSVTGTASESVNSSWANQTDPDEFDYIPVSPWGPVALVLGIGSLTGFFGIFGLALGVVGVFVSFAAIVKIRSGGGGVKGTGFAITGLVLSTVCLSLGSMKMAHAYETECPPGYERVNFPHDISDWQFKYYGGVRRLHPMVAPLIGQKVFLKGFMWETQMSEGLENFVFLKDNGECCFGGSPKPYDMMVVNMANGNTTRAFNGMVSVAGVLNANVNAKEGEPVYTVDATLVEEARTRF
ncbi:MAG: hypothetical protein GY758_07290 [Fuerstiella sp.]|nr:hypothetical protein [Fuerstiella sp.]MCP4505862.1 hypothetical protein [Fuerstiella sp.]MDG2126987.1 hypothetical protein [Fuerstiella sp.]